MSVDRPPAVDQLARRLAHHGLPHPVLVAVAREAIDSGRVDDAEELARARARRLLVPVINGTGVLLHTNLGRAPLAHAVDATYTNLELDLATGSRGSRQASIGELLAAACGAEAAMVVNNGAGAVLLCLAAVAAGKAVAVSRGELVEIGGAFRVPDVMAQSGAVLVEVGTTNRTRLGDYRQAVAARHAVAVLKVHQSNYRIVGFTEETTVAQLATLGVPVLADIGSGLLDSTCPWLDGPPPRWLEAEPAARQTLKAGASLVTFSGDKLFGGPQAGIVAGRRDLVAACARHPLARALRPGGLVLSALQATALAYLRRDGAAIPFWRMATAPVDGLRQRAEALAGGAAVTVIETESVPGGGTLPAAVIPSAGVVLGGDRTAELRARDRPILARVESDSTIIDLRTVDPADDSEVARALDAIG